MSSVVIKGNASGTGSVTIESPNTNSDYTVILPAASGTLGAGDVVGPASATDNAVARFDGTTGKLIQNSAVTIADTSGNITTGGVVLTANGSNTAPAFTASADTNTGMYFPAADTLGFATGGTQRASIDSSGNFQFNSGYGSVATAFGCRAWVNFNGTGTVAIRASGNVTSITDNNTGDYTVNFTTAMPDTNYAAVFGNINGAINANASPKLGLASGFTPQTTNIRITNDRDSTTGFLDTEFAFVAIFR